MELIKLTDKIYYLPHVPETDRPMLAYINGENIKLAIDAGNSKKHVDDFYSSLKAENLPLPNVTAITHWHWDHTFGMHCINGIAIAHSQTNKYLTLEKEKLVDESYTNFLKTTNKFFSNEYNDNQPIKIVLSDNEFKDSLQLNLGGVSARLFHCEAPHSKDTVLIYIPEERVLFLGDSTSEDYYNDGYMDCNKLKSLIKTIEQVDCDYCIVSHAAPLTKSDLLTYLYDLLVTL